VAKRKAKSPQVQKPSAPAKRVKDKTSTKEKAKTSPDLGEFRNMVSLVRGCEKVRELGPHITQHLNKLVKASGLKRYVVLLLYDLVGSIMDSTVDRLYSAIPKEKGRDILLIVNSTGGQIEPAYLISKCCREYSKRFVVAIPRKAKSAATLLALGAEEIHMGTMSELGPIDPQIGGFPALGLSNAVEHLARLCAMYPESTDMFAKYLGQKLELRTLGYFERVSESAAQYARRLLQDKKFPEGETAVSVAGKLVYSYKDHNFVIDKDEATQISGNHIKTDTEEYKLSNRIHTFL
jgi:hypothetical protein